MIYNDNEYKIINCKNEDKRSRYWCIELYPDSADSDWLYILKSLGIKCAVSPLHEFDIFDKGDKKGEYKKPHHHILFNFNYGARLSDVAPIVESINAYKHVQIVRDCAIIYDYLTHKRDKDKHQYDERDIIHINSDRYDFLNNEYKEILNFIDQYKTYSFRRLCQLLRQNEQDNLLEYVARNPYYIKTYLDEYANHAEKRISSLLKQFYESWYNMYEDNEDIDYNEELTKLKQGVDEFRPDVEELPF